MTSIKGVTGCFHGIDRGVGSRAVSPVRDLTMITEDGKTLHILRKNKTFKLTFSYDHRHAPRVWEVTFDELESARLSGKITYSGIDIKLPSNTTKLARILA